MPSLYDQGYEIGKDADHRTGDEYKYEYASNPFFKVCIFAKKVSRIKEKAYQKNNPENYREDGSDGVGNVVYGIFDSADLCIHRGRGQK